MIQEIDIEQIEADPSIQSRAGMDRETVEEYAAKIRDGESFPPVDVFRDGAVYRIADGFHRHAAAVVAGKKRIVCNVHQGDRRAALLFSLGSNAGLRRTNEDKRNAVAVMLRDSEWRSWSDREISRRCNVAYSFVGSMRRSVSGEVHCRQPNSSSLIHNPPVDVRTSAPELAPATMCPKPDKIGHKRTSGEDSMDAGEFAVVESLPVAEAAKRLGMWERIRHELLADVKLFDELSHEMRNVSGSGPFCRSAREWFSIAPPSAWTLCKCKGGGCLRCCGSGYQIQEKR